MSVDQWVIKSTMRDGTHRATTLRQMGRALGLEQELDEQCRPGMPETPTVQATIQLVADTFKATVSRVEAYYEGNVLLAVDCETPDDLKNLMEEAP